LLTLPEVSYGYQAMMVADGTDTNADEQPFRSTNLRTH